MKSDNEKMRPNDRLPPALFLRFLRWFCRPDLHERIEGDLLEEYSLRISTQGKREANRKFIIDVISLFRKRIIRPVGFKTVNHYGMYKSYITVGWRNLSGNAGYSFINIGGLALGLAVAMLIGLWIWDELSFNRYHRNYDRFAAVLQNQTYDGTIETTSSQSLQLGDELRNTYGNYFNRVVMSSFTASPILSYGDKALTGTGYFMEPEAPEILSIKITSGSSRGFSDPGSIMLSQSLAEAFFDEADPIGKVLMIDNEFEVKVIGVYENLPDNSSFNDLLFIAPLEILIQQGNRNFGWVNNWLEAYVELADHVEMKKASAAIKHAKRKNVGPELAKFKPELFLHPLSKWRLYSGFENGVNTGGRIQFVWLLGLIGAFVLLLACINFMNLSTARSERRAKEVGIRKVVGSVRGQLVAQFFTESFLIVALSFGLALILVQLALPWFNHIASKNIIIAWTNPWVWVGGIAIVMITSIVSGSYPAFYLSAFRAGKVLKGTFRTGRNVALPRKILVVIQFTVSIVLMIGTVIVYQQIQFARDRPLGYDMDGLLFVPMKTPEVKKQYLSFRNELLATGLIAEVSRSECMVTNLYYSDGGFDWRGKDPDKQDLVYRGAVDFEFGKSVGWEIVAGRDFSREFATDSLAMILNEAAVEYMGLKNPIGETVSLYGRKYTVIGVVKDMITQSLYEPVEQTFYIIDRFNRFQFINVKIDAGASTANAIERIEKIFKANHPGTPFEYIFTDEKVADKFIYEKRIGNLSGIFAGLAMIVSCLGLFGLASFVAEQRTKEIGIRKVVGASLFSLWKLLTTEFVILILISCCIALPFAYYFMSGWLQQYSYRTPISWGVFVATVASALAVTLATVSIQAVKVTLANPIKSLRTE